MNRDLSKTTAIVLFILMLLGSLLLAYQRVGLLPWASALLSVVGFGVAMSLQGRRCLICFAVVFALVTSSWAGSVYYVFTGWESGEVVDIELNDKVKFRTWVVENDGKEIAIYDCPPESQALLEASSVVSLVRGDERYDASLQASAVDLDSQELVDIYGLYEEKYAAQSRATDVYYLTIGPRRGSQLYVLYFSRDS